MVIDKNGKTSVKTTLAKSSATSSNSKTTSEKLGKIVLQPKQTIYGITKQYQISESDLRKLNPELDSHMKIGDEVILPSENIKKFGGNQTVVTAVATKVEAPAKTETIVEKEKTVQIADEDSYEIQPKDNYYKLTRKFNLSQADLFQLNPGLEAKGLQPGQFIKIKGDRKTASNTISSDPKATEVSAPVSQNTYSAISSSDDYVTYTCLLYTSRCV